MTAPGPDFAVADPELPAAGMLLGAAAPELAKSVLADMAEVELQEIDLCQIHYQPGSRIRVLYNVTVGYPDGDVRYEDLIAVADKRGIADGAHIVDPGDGPIGFWRYPWDPYLPGLPVGWDLASVIGMLEASDVRVTDVPELTSLSYSPSRHAVLRVDAQVARSGLRRGSEPASYFVKIMRPDEVGRSQRAHVALQGVVRAPRCLAWSANLGLVVMDEVPGKSIWRLLVDEEPTPEPAAFLEILDRLAAVELPGEPLDSPGELAPYSAAILKATLPDQAARVDKLVEYYVAEEPQPIITIHGDFHEDQVLFTPDGTAGIVDLDEVGPGQQVDDMAMLVGRLWSQAPFHGEHGPAFERCALELFEAFAQRLGSGKELHRRCGAAMFGRATNPFRYVEEDWREETLAILDLAERWIADGPR